VLSDSDRKDSDIKIEELSEEPEAETWQQADSGYDMIMDYSPDGTLYISLRSHINLRANILARLLTFQSHQLISTYNHKYIV
jgi:hypothetical protein